MNDTLLERELASLKAARESAAFWKAHKDDLMNKFLASSEYVDAITSAKSSAKEVEDIEQSIRDLASSLYKADGVKKPHPSVEVKIFQTFTVTDPDAVRDWCVKNFLVALVPDMKRVEKYAKDNGGGVTGTEIIDVAKVQIATKL